MMAAADTYDGVEVGAVGHVLQGQEVRVAEAA